MSSSPPNNKHYFYKVLELSNYHYLQNKSSFVHITNQSYISKDRFIKRINYLSEIDKKYLFKKCEIIKRKSKYSRINLDLPTLPLEPGDIISDGYDFYLIIDEIDNNYQCIKMEKESNELEFYIIIDGNKYYLNFDNPITYSKLLKPVRENFINNKTLHNVLVMQQQRLLYLKNKNQISRGSLIQLDKKCYYIYGEIGNEWMIFSVTEEEDSNLCQISIGGKYYYTDFTDNIKISKNNKNIKVIDLACDNEMSNIKDSKKVYHKNLQEQAKREKQSSSRNHNFKKPKIKNGTIVKIVNTSNTDYLQIVVLRSQEEIVAIRYDKYLEGKYILNKFFIDQVEFYGKVENFDLKQVLIEIEKVAKGYISQKKITKLISELKNKNSVTQTEESSKTNKAKKLTPKTSKE